MFTFFLTILPLLFLIALGFGAGRAYKLDTAQFGSFVAFTIAPLVTFGAILNLDFNMEVAMLPVAVLVISSASMIALSLGRRLLPDTLPNLAAMAAGNANTGFGLACLFALHADQYDWNLSSRQFRHYLC